jgi:two-component system sensor histidine kinase PilS (NtrC family)
LDQGDGNLLILRDPGRMITPVATARPASSPGAPFLPLAFRFILSFGLAVLLLALPAETNHPAHENVYFTLLAAFFCESVWECGRSLKRTGKPFGTPSLLWIRINLLLDILLIALLIAYQGVDQERFTTAYIFPVLASAFYLGIPEIVGVGIVTSLFHILSFFLFSTGALPAFGHSGPIGDLEPSRGFFVLGFATIQILMAVLVVVLIRKHLETLRSTLQQSEATVDELSALYRRVFESMFSGLVTLDMEGLVTSANPAAENILHRPLPLGMNLMELGLHDLFHHQGFSREQRFEREFTLENGSRRILGGNVAPIRDSEGHQNGHLLLFQDLTDLKALEERTRLNERLAAVGELSAELAHELRNPVASIQGCAQILGKGDQPQAMQQRVLKILQRESDRVSGLVSDFLDFTRPRAVSTQPCWLPTMIDEIRSSWETDPRSSGIPLHIEASPEVYILGDQKCIHQVFTNLLSNARKALRTANRREVRVRFQQAAQRIEITVEDSGCGMSPDQLKTVFLPFASGFQEGTGLGMSLVFQFVQRMGWDIRIESREGEGTQVFLGVPLA